jgi:hypothetical protein
MRSCIAKNLERLFAPQTPAGWVHGSSPKRKMVNKVIETDGNVIPTTGSFTIPRRVPGAASTTARTAGRGIFAAGRAITRRSIAAGRPASSSVAACTILTVYGRLSRAKPGCSNGRARGCINRLGHVALEICCDILIVGGGPAGCASALCSPSDSPLPPGTKDVSAAACRAVSHRALSRPVAFLGGLNLPALLDRMPPVVRVCEEQALTSVLSQDSAPAALACLLGHGLLEQTHAPSEST